jgi:hypothetical protein
VIERSDEVSSTCWVGVNEMVKGIRKKLSRILVLGIITFIFVSCAYGVFDYVASYWIKSNLNFSLKKITCTVDSVCSTTLKQALVDFVRQQAEQSAQNFNPNELYTGISKKFPSIKKFTYKRIVPDCIHFEFDGHLPRYLINSNFVLTQDGMIDHVDHYDKNLLCVINHVQVASDLLNGVYVEKLHSFLQAVPLWWWDRFAIKCFDFSCVLLQPKSNLCHYSLIVDSMMLHQHHLIGMARKLYKTLVDDAKKHNGNNWTFDLRFKNRIYARLADTTKKGKGI